MPNPNVAAPGATDVIVPSAVRTATGDSGLISGWGNVKTLRAQLAVTAVSGTTPSISVFLEDTLDGVNWNQLAAFTPASSAGVQVLNVTSSFTDKMRYRWAITGTTPSVTFAVTVYSE